MDHLFKNRRIVVYIVFITGIIVINHILSFLLMPWESYFRQVMHDIISTDDSYDVICFGSSESLYAFDSPLASELFNCNCYNVGTSGTTLDGGVYASFQAVMRKQSPSKVLIITGCTTMLTNDEDAIAYTGVQPYLHDFRSGWNYFWRMAFTGGETGRLFPWSIHHVDTLKACIENV